MKRILLILISPFIILTSYAQITGTVFDEKGEALPGVSVSIDGTTQGTTTNIDGVYELNANTGQTLVFQFIGYLTFKVEIKDKKKIDVVLDPDIVDLKEVIVMGYSNKTKNEISSAVSVVNSDQLLDVTTNDVAAMLQGKVAGVQVVNASGEPGSTAQIRIRGVSTIKPGNSEPLYVVDGIIGGDFDPNDVETLTVLKDAGATGMYGARASKGVIIVTTTKAKPGKTEFNFSASTGYNIANQGHLQMMDGKQFYDLSKEIYRDPETHEIDIIKFYNNYPRDLETRDFDWVGEGFQPGLNQKYYLSASGSTEKLSYYISGAYYNEEGTFRKTSYKSLYLRANTKYQFSKNVSLTNNINIRGNTGEYYDYMNMYYTYLSLPWDQGIVDGQAVFVDGNTPGWWSRDKINPLNSIDNSTNNSKGFSANYDLSLDIGITSWLSFSSANRISYYSDKSHNFVSPAAAGTYHDNGYIFESQNMSYDGISTDLLKFKFNKDKHSFSGLAGLEFQGGHYEYISVAGKGLPVGFDVPAVASSEIEVDGSYMNEYFRSIISQVNYNYNKKYFLTASFRVDQTSYFPPDNRTAMFPAAAAAWMISNEPFMDNVDFISELKVRSSYGITGDPDIGASRYMGLFSLSTQYNGNPAATPDQLANYGLTWEKTNELNFGVDIGILNRVNITADIYKNITSDLIVLAAQPLSQGFEYRWENSGTLTNSGIELALSVLAVKSRLLEWRVDFVFAANKNNLSGIETPFYSTIGGVSQIYKNDTEIYTFIMPKWLGVDTETGAPLWEKIVTDENGNETSREPTSNYAEATPQEVGNALPKSEGGINTFLSYKNLSLSVSMAYQYGNDVYNSTRIFMNSDGHEPYYNYMVLKDDWSIWEKPGDNATEPSWQNAELSTQTSSRFLEDGSFWKLRNVTIRYDFPEKMIGPYFKGLALSLRADNMWMWTNFWGQDPEVTLNRADWAMPGVSNFRYPSSKQFVFNVEIKF